MHNPQYWDKRALNKYDFVEKQSEEYMDKIKSIYTHAFREIDKDIHRVYTNYLKDLKNNSELPEIDTQKLKELLTKSETEKTWKELKQKGLDKYIQDNYKARISRLEQIQAQIYSKIKMISYKENETATVMYKGVINNSYYKTMFDIQQGFNQDFEFSRLDNNLINTVLDNKWSGKNYSQRIWKNTDILAEKVSDIIGGGLIRGQSIEKMSRQLREQFNAGKYYADRLARTEMCHFYNEADRMAYEELGVDKYVFMAVLDNRTSEYCQEMDNKIIEYKDIKVGENFPPLHPNCRSTTRGYIEGFEDEIKRRARNPINNENVISDNISYETWKRGKVLLKKTYENSIINVHIDDLTPCLFKKSTGQYVDTVIKKISPKEARKQSKNWQFNWGKENEIYALYSKDDKNRLQGLISFFDEKDSKAVYVKLIENNPDNVKNKTYTGIGGHLFAIAAKYSKELGYDGYVYWETKTNIEEYYHKKIGAKSLGIMNRMVLEEKEANILIQKYFKGEKND